MICKWCGETLKTGDKTCRRCRREVPALSDCGGFYDLVPGAMPVNPRATAAPEQPAAVYNPEVQPIAPVLPDHAGQRSRRKNLILLVALVVAAGLLVSTVILNGRLSEANETIEQLKSRLEKTEERVQEDTKPQDPSQGEDTKPEDPSQSEDPTEEATAPTLGGKEDEENPNNQGNQKEDDVISLEINPDNTFELTDAQKALLQTQPLLLELKDPESAMVIRLYLVLDHEANELTVWMLEGMEYFEDITMTWKVTRTGAELSGEMIRSTALPAGLPQLEWGETETEEPGEYLGCRLNIENYSINSLLECRIQCINGGETIVNITVSGVTLQ